MNGLRIRKITQKDKPRMLEIVKNIWDGNDYMPLVFDSWVKDKKGEFAGAIDKKGRLVGFEKLTMLSDSDAWIEGLRKDLKMKVKGVGKFLSEHLLTKLAKDPKVKTIRFATYFHNVESIGLFTKIGFKVLEKRNHKYLRLPKLKKIPEYKGNRAEVIKDEKAILDFINRSEWKKNNKTGFCHSWVVRPFSDSFLIENYVRKGCCVAIREDNRIKALCLYTIREKEDFFISLLEAENEKYFKELLQGVKKLAYKGGQQALCVVINKKDKISYNEFKKNRFKSWEGENDFLIFDYPVKYLEKL